MRKIDLSNGETWATNNRDGGGVFLLQKGNYRQLVGNGQTPSFPSVNSFRNYLRKRFDVRSVKIVDSYGWI